MRAKATSLSMRPVKERDARELYITIENGVGISVEISLGQIADIGQLCNQIVYAKLSGAKPDERVAPLSSPAGEE